MNEVDKVTDGTVIQLVKDGSVIDELTVLLASNLVTQLDNLLKEAKAIDEKTYSKLSYQVLLQAIDQAQAVFPTWASPPLLREPGGPLLPGGSPY